MIILAVPVQEVDPVNRETDGGEMLLRLSLQKTGPHLVQHAAEPVIDFRRPAGLMNGGENAV